LTAEYYWFQVLNLANRLQYSSAIIKSRHNRSRPRVADLTELRRKIDHDVDVF